MPRMPEINRGAVAEINLDAIAHNFGIVRQLAGNRPVLAVVKADAYGHGAIEVSMRLAAEGASYIVVAYTAEALELRKADIKTPILVLFSKEDMPDFFKHRLTPVIHDLRTARKFSEYAKKKNRRLPVHVKIDTGMGRLGLDKETAVQDIIAISRMDCLDIAGLLSHFSDADIADKACAESQLKRFKAIKEGLPPGLKDKIICHIANSAATISFKEAHLDAVRPGLMLYGCSPIQGKKTEVEKLRSSETEDFRLIPAMTVKTSILSLRRLSRGSSISYGRTFITKKESLIAVLPVGYADGYSRMLSNSAYVLINGMRVPVVGRVCMDLTMVDVTGIEGINEGDEAVLLGRQGEAEITASELAGWGSTISYEILTTMGNKSKREYTGAFCKTT